MSVPESPEIDPDLKALDRAGLIEEVMRLRGGIRKHRDASGHDLCWFHPQLWSLLPEPLETRIAVPDWPQFMAGCVAFRTSLDRDAPASPRTAEDFDPPDWRAGKRNESGCP